MSAKKAEPTVLDMILARPRPTTTLRFPLDPNATDPASVELVSIVMTGIGVERVTELGRTHKATASTPRLLDGSRPRYAETFVPALLAEVITEVQLGDRPPLTDLTVDQVGALVDRFSDEDQAQIVETALALDRAGTCLPADLAEKIAGLT